MLLNSHYIAPNVIRCSLVLRFALILTHFEDPSVSGRQWRRRHRLAHQTITSPCIQGSAISFKLRRRLCELLASTWHELVARQKIDMGGHLRAGVFSSAVAPGNTLQVDRLKFLESADARCRLDQREHTLSVPEGMQNGRITSESD